MELPKQAERVFTGVIFDVYQWEQELFNGHTTTFEMLKRLDTAEVIATKDNKILIQEQEQPGRPMFLSLPGGRIEQDEEPLEGSKRELLEETGFVSNDWELYSATQPVSKVDWNMYVYMARNLEHQQELNLDGGEKISLRWITFDELLDLVDNKELARIDQDLRADLIKAKYHPATKEALRKKIFGA